MIESHLYWNGKMPTLPEVKDKIVIVEYSDGALSIPKKIETAANYHDLIANSPILSDFKRIAILSTDDSLCEWTKEPGIITESYHTSCDCYSMPYSNDYQVCPVCTRPIKLITEPEVPAPLSIAGIPISITYNTPDNAVQWGFATRQDAEKAARKIESLLNAFATKMKGE